MRREVQRALAAAMACAAAVIVSGCVIPYQHSIAGGSGFAVEFIAR